METHFFQFHGGVKKLLIRGRKRVLLALLSDNDIRAIGLLEIITNSSI